MEQTQNKNQNTTKNKDPNKDQILNQSQIQNLNIWAKLSAISGALSNVQKSKIEISKNISYEAFSEKDVLRAIKEQEIKYRIYSYPYSRKILDTGTIETNNNGYTQSKMWIRIETVYRFINIDRPTEVIDITSYGEGLNNQEKTSGPP